MSLGSVWQFIVDNIITIGELFAVAGVLFLIFKYVREDFEKKKTYKREVLEEKKSYIRRIDIINEMFRKWLLYISYYSSFNRFQDSGDIILLDEETRIPSILSSQIVSEWVTKHVDSPHAQNILDAYERLSGVREKIVIKFRDSKSLEIARISRHDLENINDIINAGLNALKLVKK